jgi:hypothetical protein
VLSVAAADFRLLGRSDGKEETYPVRYILWLVVANAVLNVVLKHSCAVFFISAVDIIASKTALKCEVIHTVPYVLLNVKKCGII